MRRVHVIVEGRVQGVWFRETTRRTACGLRISGWVKNLSNGNVEVVAEGEDSTIEKFITYLRRGPEMARVLNVRLCEEKFVGEFTVFSIEPTEGK
jgi:acylphosphatase